MAEGPHPTDVAGDELVEVYASAVRRLELIVTAALRRGLDPDRAYGPEAKRGDATAAYRARQLRAAEAILAGLRGQGELRAANAVGRAYAAAVVAVDRTAMGEGAGLLGRFAGVHQAVAAILATNLGGRLEAAVEEAGANLRAVFARADALDGALPVRGELARIGFVGRREDDPWRRAALLTLAEREVAGDDARTARRLLVERLIREGITDATTGFVDRSGRRWGLDTYAEMAVRTTTREATSRGTANRLAEHGLNLVTISSHRHAADECTPYDGRTFALQGTEAGYPELDRLPPFHPRCRHVVTPASANLDAFERELGIGATPPTPPRERPPARGPEGRIAKLIEEEREATIERAIEGHLATPAERIAAMRERAEAGEELNDYQATLLRMDAEIRRRLPELIESGEVPELDEQAVTRIGTEVRKLATRRAGARRRKLQAERKRLEDEVTRTLAELTAASSDLASLAMTAAGNERDEAEVRELHAAGEWPGVPVELLDAYLDAERKGSFRVIRELVREERGLKAAAIRDVLAKVRPGYGEAELRDVRLGALSAFDETRATFDPGAVGAKAREELPANLAAATRLLPREWVEGSNALGPMDVLAFNGRAHYSSTGARVGTDRPYIRVRSDADSTILHELGHRMEHSRPVLRRLERDFYARRTAGEQARPLNELARERAGTGDLAGGWDDDEVGRGDAFTSLYIGKSYGPGGSIRPDSFYEVLTMGLQGLFHNDHRTDDDPDLEGFILGLLAAA